jgi:hypothetical protein
MGRISAKRFTIHLVEEGNQFSDYVINEVVLASAATRAKAEEIGSDLGTRWYEGVAIWDHLTDIIDFGGVEDYETGYRPAQPVSAVHIEIEGKEDAREIMRGAKRALKAIRAANRAAPPCGRKE